MAKIVVEKGEQELLDTVKTISKQCADIDREVGNEMDHLLSKINALEGMNADLTTLNKRIVSAMRDLIRGVGQLLGGLEIMDHLPNSVRKIMDHVWEEDVDDDPDPEEETSLDDAFSKLLEKHGPDVEAAAPDIARLYCTRVCPHRDSEKCDEVMEDHIKSMAKSPNIVAMMIVDIIRKVHE